jgi:hypothetical protein
MVFQELHPGFQRSDRSAQIVDLAHRSPVDTGEFFPY